MNALSTMPALEKPSCSVKSMQTQLRLRLHAHGYDVAEARNLTAWMLAHLLDCGLLDVLRHQSRMLDANQCRLLESWQERLLRDEPIQYILGCTEFMGHTFKTDHRALIPRPETELLVEAVLNCHAFQEHPTPCILDVGTGSGCVALSLALARPKAQVTGLDISLGALELARENANLLVAKVIWLQNDLLRGQAPATADIIAANLPYIARKDIKDLDKRIRLYEPIAALDGGEEGFDLVRLLVEQAVSVLKPQSWLFLEIGEDQARMTMDVMTATGFHECFIKKDLAGLDRIAGGRTA